MKTASLAALVFASALAGADTAADPPGLARRIRVQPDQAPDCSSLKAIVESVTRGCTSNDEKAVAIYNFMQLTHYHRQYPSEKDLSALKEINVYGWGLCGGLHAVQSALWRELGWKWRFVGWSKPGHTTVEAEYDGTWHYLDVFLKFYAWMPDAKAPGGRRIAGQDDLKQNAQQLLTDGFVFDAARKVWYAKGGQFAVADGKANWTAPAFLVCGDGLDGVATGVNNKSGAGSPEAWAGINHATGGYSTDVDLAPGFALTSTWNPVPDAWYWANAKEAPSHSCNNKDFRNSPENGPVLEPYLMPGRDRRSYANGTLTFRGDFAGGAVLKALAQADNVRFAGGALTPVEAGKPASVVVRLRSPYVITMASGAAEGAETVELSRDGGAKYQAIELKDFSAAAKGAYDILIRLTFAKALTSLRLDATVQNNPCALPWLAPGRNRVEVSLADAKALGDNALIVTYAYFTGERNRTYEELCAQGNEIAKAHGAKWSQTPTVVQKTFKASDLPAAFDIDIATPKGRHPVYPRMLFVRREVLPPGASPLPLPEGALPPAVDPGSELKTLPNPFLTGIKPAAP